MMLLGSRCVFLARRSKNKKARGDLQHRKDVGVLAVPLKYLYPYTDFSAISGISTASQPELSWYHELSG